MASTYSQGSPTLSVNPDDVAVLVGSPVNPGNGGGGTGGDPGPTDPGTGGGDGGGTSDPTPPPASTVAAALADALASLAVERAARLSDLTAARMTPNLRGPLDLAAGQLVYIDRAIDETIRAGVIAQILEAS